MLSNEILKDLLTSATLSKAYDIDNNEVIDITIHENAHGVYALCMDKNGDIHFYKEVKPMKPQWLTRNIKDIASANELCDLYEALKSIRA